MKKFGSMAVRTTALVAVVSLAAACGAGGRDEATESSEGSTVGITDTSVKIGAHFPLTGVAAPGYSEIPTGAKAYFDYVNAAGGINGRQIEYVVRDDSYDPTTTTQVVNELVLQDEVFAVVGGLGTATHSAVIDFLNEEGVPDLFVSSGAIMWGNDPEKYPNTFGWQPDYQVEGKIIGDWVTKNRPDAKVGLFLQDDDLGRDSEAAVRQYLDDQIVEVVRYTSGNTDVAPQIAALQGAGADLILGFNVPSYTALSQLTAMRLNYDPEWFYSSIGSDVDLVGSLLGRFSQGSVTDGASSLEGMISLEYIPGIDSPESPWTQLWQKVWAENGTGEPLTNYRIYGMSQAYAFVQALEAAGENPTREGIVAAVQDDGMDFEGPQLAPFRYSESSHLGISGASVFQIQGGVPEYLTPVLQTDIGDSAVEEYTGEASTPPESGIPG
ncbi:Amino acid/amide ABC transporter substrate-binding protein, HAAT family [Rhodococcus sp. AW25M09]|uniref:ABC transporter substrate-binding protein n=1 Tax=Rhodococcus sp. AW25M09 TaxID=1268303 RepID=UPI0002AD0D86|nr:ABC transporter substrate-binding protein [Rhodococcus sp. AW25M09]CCQ13754.1 Amino acid/amide ABC transporter substrate-binding protein, HAAT family [Rhodococcus sp. AW25M09]